MYPDTSDAAISESDVVLEDTQSWERPEGGGGRSFKTVLMDLGGLVFVAVVSCQSCRCAIQMGTQKLR